MSTKRLTRWPGAAEVQRGAVHLAQLVVPANDPPRFVHAAHERPVRAPGDHQRVFRGVIENLLDRFHRLGPAHGKRPPDPVLRFLVHEVGQSSGDLDSFCPLFAGIQHREACREHLRMALQPVRQPVEGLGGIRGHAQLQIACDFVKGPIKGGITHLALEDPDMAPNPPSMALTTPSRPELVPFREQ